MWDPYTTAVYYLWSHIHQLCWTWWEWNREDGLAFFIRSPTKDTLKICDVEEKKKSRKMKQTEKQRKFCILQLMLFSKILPVSE